MRRMDPMVKSSGAALICQVQDLEVPCRARSNAFMGRWHAHEPQLAEAAHP